MESKKQSVQPPFTMVCLRFMPPDDPLGRRGPTLDQFLMIGTIPTNAQPCPYAKKCTYGNKCKYYHPERPNGVRVSVTDRLLKERNNRRNNTPTRPSVFYENNGNGVAEGNGFLSPHNNVGRTQSVNLPPTENDTKRTNDDFYNKFVPVSIPSSFPFPPPAVGAQANGMPFLDNLLPWNSANESHRLAHSSLNRHISAPIYHEHTQQTPMANGCDRSMDDAFARTFSTLEVSGAPELDSCGHNNHFFRNAAESHMFAPSTAVWGESEFSVVPVCTTRFCPPTNSSTHSPSNGREKLQYHLCQLFPETTVLAVMSAHPEENDAQVLCRRILDFQKGFADA
jgi:hypothetical protein